MNHCEFRKCLSLPHFARTTVAFDKRTRSTREIWRQLQATRYHNANPNLSINTQVSGTADPPEVVFKFIDNTEVRTGEWFIGANYSPCIITRSLSISLELSIERNGSIASTWKQMKLCLMSTLTWIAWIMSMKWAGSRWTIRAYQNGSWNRWNGTCLDNILVEDLSYLNWVKVEFTFPYASPSCAILVVCGL